MKIPFAACAIAAVFASTSCSDKSTSESGRKLEVPKAYGVYLQTSSGYERVDPESTLPEAKPVFVTQQPLRVLVFARENGGGAASLETQISLAKGVLLTRTVEQIVPNTNGYGSIMNNERSAPIGHTEGPPIQTIEETQTGIKLQFEPVQDTREAVIVAPRASLETGTYVFTMHGKKLPVVVGASALAEVPEHLKYDLWLTTLHQSAGAVQQLQAGSGEKYNGRRILQREARPSSAFVDVVAEAKNRFDTALREKKAGEALVAFTGYRAVAPVDAPKVSIELSTLLDEQLRDASGRGDWDHVLALVQAMEKHTFDNGTLRETKARAEETIAQAEAEASHAFDARLAAAREFGKEIGQVKDVKPLGNTDSTALIIYEGGISWVQTRLFSPPHVVRTSFIDLPVIKVDDRTDGFSGKKASTASFGYNSWLEFQSKAHRDDAIRRVLQVHARWAAQNNDFLRPLISVPAGRYTQKVLVKGSRFAVLSKGPGVVEVLEDESTRADTLQPDRWYDGSERTEYVRFRGEVPASAILYRFTFSLPEGFEQPTESTDASSASAAVLPAQSPEDFVREVFMKFPEFDQPEVAKKYCASTVLVKAGSDRSLMQALGILLERDYPMPIAEVVAKMGQPLGASQSSLAASFRKIGMESILQERHLSRKDRQETFGPRFELVGTGAGSVKVDYRYNQSVSFELKEGERLVKLQRDPNTPLEDFVLLHLRPNEGRWEVAGIFLVT